MRLDADPGSGDDRPTWLWGMERAAQQLREENPERYGEGEQGATIGQTWHMTSTLLGVPMVCALMDGQPAHGTESIPTVVTLPWPKLRDQLHRVLEAGGAEIPAFVHDGRSGHVINLGGRHGDGYHYFDPWPGDSLLCRHQNAAGVDAQQHGENAWTITEEELGRVLIGLHVMPTLWAEASGQPGAVRYDALRQSEFWSFFGVHERPGPGPGAVADETGVTIALSTGGFTDDIALEVRRDERGRITTANLRLREEWAIGPPWGLNPHALDITRSFLNALTPQADQAALEPALPPLMPPEAAGILRDTGRQDTPAWQLLAAYAGGIPDVRLRFSLCAVTVSRPGDGGWIQIEVMTF